MSDAVHHFARASVLLPFDLDQRIGAYGALQRRMARERPEAFTRDEWAYLISFLDERQLWRTFTDAFGERVTEPVAGRLVHPRGRVALWLPNNVSLLGPLTLILLSLTGNRVRAKAGAHADDLASAFLAFAGAGLFAGVEVEQFGRDDPRNRDMAAAADVRIAFGSNASMQAIDALPHPICSSSFWFADRQSEAWLDPDRLDDETVMALAKVFAIYGQTGCTSPRRAVLLGGTLDDARNLRERLADVWPRVVRSDVAMHLASQNVMAAQWAAALGWEACTTPRNAAALAAGTIGLEIPRSPFLLAIAAAPAEESFATLPPNIQTIGHNFEEPAALAARLAAAGVKRIVPLGAMHHFGPVWDGYAWWRGVFEECEAFG